MSYLHYFTNRYRNRVSRKREFFNLYKIFVIQNKQKAIRFSFQNLTALLSCCVPKSSIFTCNICTKSRGLFSGYFSAAYAFRTLILLTFGRSFQRVPWQMKSTLIIKFSCSEMPYNAEFCKVLSAFSSIVFFLLITTLFANHFKIGQGILAFMLFIYKNIVFRYVEILLHSFSNRNKSILPAF